MLQQPAFAGAAAAYTLEERKRLEARQELDQIEVSSRSYTSVS